MKQTVSVKHTGCLNNNHKIQRNDYFIRPNPLEAAVKQDVFAGKRACMFEWRRKPTRVQARRKNGLFDGKFGAAKPTPWGRLSLLTFFDEAKKVSCPCGNEAQSKQFLQSIQAA
ncbi:MAG: hypothetical protein Q4G42_04675 [Neisseria sp.]|nr:hypothetical protein [Neisseria sp.]